MNITHINDQQDTLEFIAERRINSIVSDVQVASFGLVDIIAKIDVLLADKKLRSAITQDQEIDLGAFREKLRRDIDHYSEFLKKI
jgi:hypothetical protein